jgi:hypothetical protein
LDFSRKRAAALASSVLAASVIFTARSTPLAHTAPRTPDERPDLQGLWLNNTATPLERPKDLAGKEFFTDDEAQEYEGRYLLDRTVALSPGDPRFELQLAGDLDTYEPGHILPSRRTSLITDPADGRVPALVPEARRLSNERAEHLKTHYADNPEDFPNADRCLMIGNAAAPPLLPVFYNNNVQIVQTRDDVMILSEMIHDARVIPLDGRAHLPANIRQWKGDSIGRWEGETLVVDTTNFTDKTTLRGSGRLLHVIERFTLSDPDTLTYRFTIDDPASFVRSWSGESMMFRTRGRMFEYACHEANYSLSNVLRGARFAEQAPPKRPGP